jgi:exonuclease III
VILGKFNTPLSPIDRTSRKNINKETLGLNDTIDQMNLTDIYRVFHLATEKYTFFSTAHGTVYKENHILDHTANLNKYKKIEITPTYCLIITQ